MRLILLVFVGFIGFARAGESHEMDSGEVLINPYDRYIDTRDFLVTFDHSDGKTIKVASWIDREAFLNEAEFGIFLLLDKKTGYRGQYEIILDGGFEPRLLGIETEDYCGVEVILVFVQRAAPRYGGSLSRWLTTYIFRADTFEMLEEYSGTPYDITRFDSRVVPEVDSIMDERFLVSCFPAGRGRPFDFGLIDRKRLYGHDWCGPSGRRCRVLAPTTASGEP